MTLEQKSRAHSFLAMHQAPPLLVLLNAWDAASARVFEKAGARAIATTSAGIAFALGYRDGQVVSRKEMLEAVTRITAVVHLPVTADLEGGYGPRAEDVAETTRQLLRTGAVGFNLEDAKSDASDPLFEVPEQVERIRAARETAEHAGVHLVINARTDVFLGEVGEPSKRLGETVRRLNAYREAGADCLFAPGVTDAATIKELVRQVSGPLNLLVGVGLPGVTGLERLGVARISVGSGIMRAALGSAREAATEILQKGTYATFVERGIPFREINELMAGGRPRVA
jgi:2-methylisocitrate lyase-like PEP mutase family enzyme